MLTLEKIIKEKRSFLIHILEKIKEQSEITTIMGNGHSSDNIFFDEIQCILNDDGYITIKEVNRVVSLQELFKHEYSKFKLCEEKVVFKDCIFITKKGEELLEKLKNNII